MFGMAIAMHPIAYREPRGGAEQPPRTPLEGVGYGPPLNPPLRCAVKGQSRRLRKVLGVQGCNFYHVGGECNWVVIICKASPLELDNESKNEIHIVKLQK